ncbi:MAG: AbgT family transporter [Bacilli bacterium]|nr:AbgT family transporter [Bacilli bacterium]
MLEETSKKGKKIINNCIWFFIILTLLTVLLSFIGSKFGWQGTYSKINEVTLSSTKEVVAVDNLLSADNIKYIIGNFVNNFVTFAPLGMLLVCLIGIGVAYKTEYLPTLFSIIGKKMSRFWLTFVVVIVSILSGFAGENWYVLLIPLSAIFFLSNNRNPVVGILASFVAATSGHGINVFLSSLDYNLTPYTEVAAKLIDKNYNIGLSSNLFFCIVSTISLAFLITFITEKIVLPKIQKYKRDELMIEEVTITRKEKRGFILARLGIIIMSLIFIYMIIPGLPGSGILLDSTEKSYIGKLFGSNSYFEQGIMFFIPVVLLISGLLYGIGTKVVKTAENVTSLLYQSLNNIGSILVLIFFASQFIAIFKRTNFGTVITAWAADIIQALNISSFPLVLLLFILVGIISLFFTSSITKWAILSPVVIPMFMKANITPEFTQAIYRVGSSATSILTPLMASFIILIGYLEIYNQNEQSISIGKTYKLLWPYTIALTILWLFIILAWYIIGLPIGVNTFPTV